MKTWISNAVNQILRKFDLKIINTNNIQYLNKNRLNYAKDNLYTYNNADFIFDKKFKEAYQLSKQVDRNRLLKNVDIEWRIHTLCWAAANAIKLEGDFVDCGVGNGIFSRAIIHYTDFALTDKRYYLLDTFSGLDKKWSSADELRKSKHMPYNNIPNQLEEVKEDFKNFNTKIISGSIPETLNEIDTPKISFLSFDMNSALPEQKALAYLWDRIVHGGYVIFDDYGYGGHTYKEQKRVSDQFAEQAQQQILTLPTGQGLLIKV